MKKVWIGFIMAVVMLYGISAWTSSSALPWRDGNQVWSYVVQGYHALVAVNIPMEDQALREGKKFVYNDTGSSQAWYLIRANTTNADTNKTLMFKLTGYGASNPIKIYRVSNASQATTGLTETEVTWKNLDGGSSASSYFNIYTTDTFANHGGITAETQLIQTGNQIALGDGLKFSTPSDVTYLEYYIDVPAVQRYLNMYCWSEAKSD